MNLPEALTTAMALDQEYEKAPKNTPEQLNAGVNLASELRRADEEIETLLQAGTVAGEVGVEASLDIKQRLVEFSQWAKKRRQEVREELTAAGFDVNTLIGQ